jgi:hypothetical protein
VEPEAVAREIGRRLQRMAERTRDEEGYVPHPIAVAIAEAVRGGNLTDGDGTFGAQEQGYQVHMSKANGHFALLDVVNLKAGRVLAAPVVLRLLHAHDLLADHPGEAVHGEVAEGLVSGLLGVDDGSSALLLRKAGLHGPRLPKAALLEFVEGLPG